MNLKISITWVLPLPNCTNLGQIKKIEKFLTIPREKEKSRQSTNNHGYNVFEETSPPCALLRTTKP